MTIMSNMFCIAKDNRNDFRKYEPKVHVKGLVIFRHTVAVGRLQIVDCQM
uniref:Uncharacterized protein n=1 Tax=Kuenenia stuttgartiensis TaxID=174633 RepID=Q1PVD4_KUEST|nr:unknown protein [Candidatus Kuenenia stuttgartiensis]